MSEMHTNTDTDADKYILNGVGVMPNEFIEIVTNFLEAQHSRVIRLTARIAELEAENNRLAELLNNKAVFIKFENEDELPAEIKDDVYSAMFECSHVDGVRLFPYIEENGQKYFLVMLKEVV